MLARRRRLRHHRRQRRIAEPCPDREEERHEVEQRHAQDAGDEHEADGVRRRADRDERPLAERARQFSDQASLDDHHHHTHEDEEIGEVDLLEAEAVARVQRDARLHPGDGEEREEERQHDQAEEAVLLELGPDAAVELRRQRGAHFRVGTLRLAEDEEGEDQRAEREAAGHEARQEIAGSFTFCRQVAGINRAAGFRRAPRGIAGRPPTTGRAGHCR